MMKDRLSISSWSVHRLLGASRWTVWDEASAAQAVHAEEGSARLTLLELPGALAARGFRYLELCHFHLPSVDEAYVSQLKEAIRAAGIKLHTLLIDYGDLSSADSVRRASDEAYMQGWIDIAARLDASAVRVVAGEQPAGDDAAIARSAAALQRLYRYGQEQGVDVVTENFRELTATLASWQSVMAAAGGRLRTIVDFGNMQPEEKEAGIAFGAPIAHAIHAKPVCLADGSIDERELRRSMDIAQRGGCEAPVSVIFDREGDVWEGIERIARILVG